MEDRYRGSLIGLAVGDALGARYEFYDQGEYEILGMPDDDHPELKPGYWTDDTSMALCLADSLIYCKGFYPNDQMYRYLRWISEGFLSPFGYAYGVGGATFNSINAFIDNPKDPYAGSTDPKTAGNGSLMRLAPIPMLYRKDPLMAEKYAELSSKTTHQAKESIDACRVYTHMIVRALWGDTKEEILARELSEMEDIAPRISSIAKGSYETLKREQVKTSGYVVHTLEAALWAFFHSDNFRDGMLLAVNLGGDIDTIGAIYGQLAGAHYGYEAIPEEWRDAIAMKDLIEGMALQLFSLSHVILDIEATR